MLPLLCSFSPILEFYSGSFDPPTVNHLKIIRKIAASGLRKVYVLVNRSGAKDFKTSTSQRIAMLKSGLEDLSDKVEFLPVDQDHKDELIHRLQGGSADNFYYDFIGEDSFDLLPTSVSRISHRQIVMIPREGDKTIEEKARKIGADVLPLEGLVVGSSSTRLRADIAAGKLDSPYLDPKLRPSIEHLDAYHPLVADLLMQRRAQYKVAYVAVMRKLESQFPNLHPTGLPPPPFLDVQSPEEAQRLRDFAYGRGLIFPNSCDLNFKTLVP
jgi:nicotinic acid mononucleotide adenylyltransferase